MENQNPLSPEIPETPQKPSLFGSKAADIIIGILASIFGPLLIVIATSPIHPAAGLVIMPIALIAFIIWATMSQRAAIFAKTCIAIWGICLVIIPLIALGRCLG